MAARKPGSKPPPAPSKFWHALKHKNLDIFKFDLDADEDQNYSAASEQFLEFQTQLGAMLHRATLFRKMLADTLQVGVELADDFGRLANGQGGARVAEPWAQKAGEQAFFLKGMFEESAVSVQQHLGVDLDEKVVRPLSEEEANFQGVQLQMRERSNMKMDMLHYSNKVQELKGSQKATDEKKDRNKEKYAQASQALRDQTNQLMSIFAHAEQLREKVLTQSLPATITAKKNTFDSIAINLNKADAETSDGEPRPPRMSDAARIPHRVMPASDFPTTPPGNALAEVSLDDTSPTSEPPAYSSPFPVKVEPPAAGEVTQTIVKKRSPMPMSPKEDGAPWSGNGGGGEFGDELKRAQEHQNSKMAAESAAATGRAAAAKSVAISPTSTAETAANPVPSQVPLSDPFWKPVGGDGEGSGRGTPKTETVGALTEASAAKGSSSPTPELELESERFVPEYTTRTSDGDAVEASLPPAEEAEEGEEGRPDEGDGDGAGMEELPPGKVRVRALYDYQATESGDLSFNAGDMIITDAGAFSGDGWVSGDCCGKTGIFPANYTEPW